MSESLIAELRRLQLEHTAVTDEGLGALTGCMQLQYLNLTSTGIGDEGLGQLKGLPALTRVYLYETNVSGAAVADIQEARPDLGVDTGGYVLPTS